MSTTSFAELHLSPEALAALRRAGFEHPTPIQAQAIPPALAGKDVIGTAATGTGKTAAFLLPLIDRLAGKPGTRALVLAPTRELALQIGEELERFGHARRVRGAVIIGGVGMAQQAEALRQKREIVIATPGRLVDHLEQGNARLDGIEALVLDEADRMLDMGFKPQLDRILRRLPKQRQTLLFSATMAGEVADFARAHLRDPVRVEVARSGTTAARAEQQVFLADQHEKLPLLLTLLERDGDSTLIFTRTKRRADKIWKHIGRAGHKVARIHADRSQAQRRMALDGFKDGTYRVLVATDIAARGIDVAEIGHVVNFDLPHVPEDYVHRVGRTARAAASGRASSFSAPDERDLLHAIERLTRAVLPRAPVPRDAETFQSELKRAAAAQADPGPAQPRHRTSQPAAPRARRRAEARPQHAVRSKSGGASAAGGAGGEGGGGSKPRLVGSWSGGSKRRR
ncbi:DEAD/DEAH box helicase [Anaeromyxobacter sp. Fw109-5]|uniref:DEAD/DEAH box helicase n=1 Tax=Anaeromyxobacter sp. (strain Fw109-5) TaxID=404589 RepID=UPI0000ED71B5|nr:DEAD/DEAH box helicase [Anaeromyxobacter sp. Fw109-5]ABS27679.1 DEAD/DEAH box helicase domain protein [Anaeromyxobacter sp. Fw109-5]